MLDSLLLTGNAVICILTVIRLMFFQGKGRTNRRMAFIAYCMILAFAWTAFRIAYGQYVQVDISEIFIDFLVCIAVWRAKGNVAHISSS
ncbi:phage holin family protein [Leclercia pneumoniae]|uniref:phage holin family protein n=1 Tax=Leclercia pneumoniae TaxID=2815358 RepID=UPI003AF5A051